MITDIEGSTRLLKTWGDRYESALERHNELLRTSWRDHHGVVVNTEGDSFIVAFEDPGAAVAACVAGMTAIEDEPWGDVSIRIRIGAHRGPARPKRNDYVALALHQTARVSAAANGGQAIVTPAVLDACPEAVRAGSTALGRFRLRDFDDAVELRLLAIDGRPPVMTPLRVLPADGHNLARPQTPFIGRSEELATIAELIAPGTLTTICGPGGIGKTRLALEFGRAHARNWDDGVWMTSLAALRHGRDVPDAIAGALSVDVPPGGDTLEQLCEVVRARRCVVILDNCEQLVTEVASVAHRLLDRCGGVALLATSREPIGLTGERRLRVEPLSTRPEPGRAHGPAVELFSARARAVGSTATLDDDTVERLCERLDGLPLGIEMAAARSDVLSPSEILDSLERRPQSIRTTDPLRPPRHRSVEAVIDWSYDLLDERERAVLRRLTVLPASFDLDTAIATCADGSIDADDIPEVVWSLVSKSVVRRRPEEGATRYQLFATVRSRVSERAGSEESAGASRRLADYLVGLVGPGEQKDLRWAARVDAELDNLRGVVARTGEVDDPVRLRLLWSIGRLYDDTDRFTLGIEEIDAHCRDARPCPELVGVLTLLADLRLRTGDIDGADDTLERAERLEAEVGPADWDRGGSARTRGELALRRGQLDLAERVALRTLEGDIGLQPSARLWNLLGLVRAFRDDLAGATEAFERELAIWSELGSETSVTVTHGNLAEAFLRRGDVRSASRHQLECLHGANELGRPILVGFSLTVAAHLAGDASDWTTALTLQGASDELLHRARYALYEFDQENRSELIARAETEIGAERVSTALAAGRSLAVQVAVEQASRLLDAAARSQ